MTERDMYLMAEESILDEIANTKKLFSFHTLIKLFTAGSIAKKL